MLLQYLNDIKQIINNIMAFHSVCQKLPRYIREATRKVLKASELKRHHRSSHVVPSILATHEQIVFMVNICYNIRLFLFDTY